MCNVVQCAVLLTEPGPRAGTLSGAEPNELVVSGVGVCRLNPVLLLLRPHAQQFHALRLAVGLRLRKALAH